MANNRLLHEVLGNLDLHSGGLGRPDIPGLWDVLREDKRPVEKRQLLCRNCLEEFGERVPMYVWERSDGMKIGVHQYGDAERRHSPPESPEHKAYKERIHRTATEAGFDATVERRSDDGSIRSDVLISGANGPLAWEVQRSDQRPQNIGRRDAHARRNGAVVAWHTDNMAFAKRNEVPWLRTHVMPPEVIAKQPVLPVGGVTRLRWERCDWRRATPCPIKGRGRCGNLHPEPEPDRADLDYVVRRAAEGAIIRMVLRGTVRDRKLWVPADDRRRCEEAGLLAPEAAEPSEHPSKDGGASNRAPTCAERHQRGDDPPHTQPSLAAKDEPGCNWNSCGRPGRPFPCGQRCQNHTPLALRGLPELPSGPGWPRDRTNGGAA